METRPREGVNVTISCVIVSKHGRKTVGREVCDLFHMKPNLRVVRLTVCNIANVHMSKLWCDNNDGICCRCVNIEGNVLSPQANKCRIRIPRLCSFVLRRKLWLHCEKTCWKTFYAKSVWLFVFLRATVLSRQLRLVHPHGGEWVCASGSSKPPEERVM